MIRAVVARTLAVLLVAAAWSPRPVRADAVVGTGTASSCTEAALNVALGCGAPSGSPPVTSCTGGGNITFNCGGAATITVTSTKTISAATAIDGGGMITISGGNSVGVFSVNTGIKFTVQNLSIANGKSTSSNYGGGGILNYGALTVTNSTFSGNSATSPHSGGGGICNIRTLTVSNSTFTGNSAVGNAGGGIYNNGTVTLSNSTFSGNSAIYGGGGISSLGGTLTVAHSTFSGNNTGGNAGGGGIYNNESTLTVSNSTFWGNSVTWTGGGIENEGGTVTVTNSTFSGNSAYEGPEGWGGGGIANNGGTVTVTNTIIANSTSGGNCGGGVTDGGHNIDDGTTCGFSPANGSLNSTSPGLDPAGLANNGGPTQTIALEAGSRAINAGNETVCAAPPVNNLDQRDFVRPGTGAANCSIGACEYNSTRTSDCCQCPASCAVPINGSCGGCILVFSATCEGGDLCVVYTPTPSPTRTATPSPAPTSLTPSPTPCPTATNTPGTNDCCQCSDFCAAPVVGTCGGCTVVLGATCTGGYCIPRTPSTPTSTPTATLTATITSTPTETSTPTRRGTYTPKGTATPTRTATPTWTANATPTWTPRWAGYYACRGGIAQGEVCGLDAQCPGVQIPPSTPAICTWGGHPRVCMNAPACMISGNGCTDNLDCPGWGAATPTPANYCPGQQGLYMPKWACNQDSDCGLCVGGTAPGQACTSNSRCPSGTCSFTGGKCINGYQQGQADVYPQGSGWSGDPYADYCLLNQTCESDQHAAVNSTTARFATGLKYFPELDKLVHFMSDTNTVRIQGWEAASTLTNNAPISWFLGAIDINHGLWENIPGDNTIYGNMAPNSLDNVNGLMGGFAYDPVTDSLWVSDVDNVREYSSSPHSKELPNRVLGHTDFTGYNRVGLVCHGGTNDGTSCNPNVDCPGGTCVPNSSNVYTCSGGSNNGNSCNVNDSCTGGGTCNRGYFIGAAGIAALPRCNGTTSFGTSCTTNGGCSDGTCTTTLLVVDTYDSAVAGWENISSAVSGAIPDFYLGQIDGVQGSCNQGLSAPTAATLCYPADVAFDTSGNIYVSDSGNGRVVRFPFSSKTGASATVVFGASGFTSCGTLFASSCGGWGQGGLTVDPVTGALSVADTYASRILAFTAPFTSPVTSPTYCIGQANCSGTSPGQSSDGTKLDRLAYPRVVTSDGNGGVYVGDTGNNRDLHFSAPLASNEAADLLLGQTSATSTMQLNAHTESGLSWGGICFYSANGKTGVCKVAQSHNRALCWNDWTIFGKPGAAPETDADAILGQADGVRSGANAGGLSASSLSSPLGCAADAGHLYIADSGNNRVTRYTFGSPAALTTQQAADTCYGQTDCAHNSTGRSATQLNHPTDVKVDGYGNLWIVDQGNYRVLLMCNASGTLGRVCTVANSSDATWDLVLGQVDFVHAVQNCTGTPGANEFCLPWSVIPDVITGSQVLVSDAYPSGDAARVQIFAGPWTNGMSASSTLGQLSTTLFTFYSGVCVNGTNAGAACSETGDQYLQGGTSTACPGGYCSYGVIPLRSAGVPVSMALTTWHSPRSLWVTRVAGMARWLEPFTTGKLATLKTASNTNHAFDFWNSGYVESQPDHVGGGIAEAPDGSIWYAQGGISEAVSAIWAMMDPEGEATATITPSAPPITPTHTPTATPTDTPRGTLPSPTVTYIGTPFAPTPTNTVTPVATITRTPTPTPTVPPTSTPRPCAGDCNDDGTVTVDDIITMVNIALGNANVSACEAGDTNHDGQITVDEILTAVNNALNGCGRNPFRDQHVNARFRGLGQAGGNGAGAVGRSTEKKISTWGRPARRLGIRGSRRHNAFDFSSKMAEETGRRGVLGGEAAAGFIRHRFGPRIKQLQHRYFITKWRGGITVSDGLASRPGALLF